MKPRYFVRWSSARLLWVVTVGTRYGTIELEGYVSKRLAECVAAAANQGN